jgi:uncharacterized protein
MLKIILDTNIYFSDLAFDRQVLRLLDYCYLNHQVYGSESILLEIRQKLTGQKIQKVSPKLIQSEVIEFLTKVEQEIILVESNCVVAQCRDPKDNQFLELAQTIQVDYIITGDLDLLEIANFKKTVICKPSQFISTNNLHL